MARYDVTVRGAGIFGLSIAYEAARRGAKVQVIETVAIGAGSSGGLVGALTPHVPDDPAPMATVSITCTFAPRLAASYAMDRPKTPAPRTVTSYLAIDRAALHGLA